MPFVDSNTISNPTTGQPIIASLGDNWRDSLVYLAGGFPHASILESTPQSITNATETDLTSNEENSDIGGLHSTSSTTERMTVPAGEGGLYRIIATVTFAANATGYRVLSFRKNNTTNYDCVVLDPVQSGGVPTTFTGSRSLVLAAGDYITCRVFQNSGGALNCTMVDYSMEWRATA